jgi:hypothetical protein
VTWPPRPIFAAFKNALQIGTIRAAYSAGHYISYLDLASQLCRWDCADARDRLYSIMGLHPDTRTACFMPNYKLTMVQLFKDFARGYISTTKRLEILHHAGISTINVSRNTTSTCAVVSFTRASNLCSWAPDWSMRTRPKPLYHNIGTSTALACTSTFEVNNPLD